MTTIDKVALIQRAEAAAANSYAIYSGRPKGAAVLADDGTIYTAAAVENAAYGAAICAESSAVACAVAAGQRAIVAVALAPARLPCGICLQVLREFGLTIQVITRDEQGQAVTDTVQQLLPESFGPAHLGK